MKTRTPVRYTIRRLPHQVTVAMTMALAISFAAGAATVSHYPNPQAQPAQPDILPAIYISPFEYFPGRYENGATDVEPQPPTF